MQQLIKYLLLLLLPIISSVNHVHWLGNYDKALQQAKKENKPLLVFVDTQTETFMRESIYGEQISTAILSDRLVNLEGVIAITPMRYSAYNHTFAERLK